MFSLEDAKRSLSEDGYVEWKDSDVGDIVSQLEERCFAFMSRWGLDYCDDHVFNDTRCKEIIGNTLGPCFLGHWLRYGAFPDNIECYRKGGSDTGLQVLAVQHLCKGSKVELFPDSHLHNLPTKVGVRLLFETTREDLLRSGCRSIVEDYPDGGLIIRDARLFTTIKKGYAITWLFGKGNAISRWAKIPLPSIPDLIRRIVQMETSDIKINFEIAHPAPSNAA
ncbi:hypothetical protein LCI18_001804 [Fusarium solani-melongenae]|uniref:Uncharacterized protein n=1 Tax=Fusarium solani subsp. cucurbitae TaxID=2747967 RepID=A0ACD3YPI3_FUSSC|nr:hypothetical protein LCI18_001804 [Fusarium solani-melongenae]